MKNYLLKNSARFGWGQNKLTPDYKIKELLPLIQGKKVLDIGCGPGHFVDVLTKNNYTAIGVDIIPEFIEFAKKNYQGKFLVANAYELPFKNKEFDTVFIRNVLEHIKDDKKALSEAIRVGKKIIIYVPRKTPHILKTKGLIFSHYQDKSHFRTYTKKSLKKLISASQGKLIQIKEVERLPSISIFYELFKAPKIVKKIITKIFFTIFKEKNFYLELLAVIKHS